MENYELICKSPSNEIKHRNLYKISTPPWKETYRKRCQERLSNNRLNLLSKLRNSSSSNNDLFLATSVQDIIKIEWHGMTTDAPFLAQYQNENLDEMLSIFDEITAELIQEEKKILEQYNLEARLIEEETNTAANSFYYFTSDRDVICPICHKSSLHIVNGIVSCNCGLLIDTEQDAITLDMIQSNLSEAVEEHSNNCIDKPIFSVFKQPNISNLMMSCKTCDLFFIVI